MLHLQVLRIGTAIFCMGIIGCAKIVSFDKKKVPLAAPAQAAKEEKPEVKETLIGLNFVTVRPEAWWNSCISLDVNGTTVDLGCSKGAIDSSKQVNIPVKPGECNKVTVTAKVETGCPAGNTCKKETFSRVSSKASDAKFFKLMEASKLVPGDPNVHTKEPVFSTLPDIKKQAEEFTKSGKNSWFRLFFEDQNDTRYESWETGKRAGKDEWSKFGIDYDDFVFDLKAENVQISLNGLGGNCN